MFANHEIYLSRHRSAKRHDTLVDVVYVEAPRYSEKTPIPRFGQSRMLGLDAILEKLDFLYVYILHGWAMCETLH